MCHGIVCTCVLWIWMHPTKHLFWGKEEIALICIDRVLFTYAMVYIDSVSMQSVTVHSFDVSLKNRCVHSSSCICNSWNADIWPLTKSIQNRMKQYIHMYVFVQNNKTHARTHTCQHKLCLSARLSVFCFLSLSISLSLALFQYLLSLCYFLVATTDEKQIS